MFYIFELTQKPTLALLAFARLAPKLAKDKHSILMLIDKGFILLKKDENVIPFLRHIVILGRSLHLPYTNVLYKSKICPKTKRSSL